jgi:hypothetical protein
MLGEVVNFIMGMAAAIADWFVATDDPNYDLIQMAIAILMITTVVAIGAFGPAVLALWRNRKTPPS